MTCPFDYVADISHVFYYLYVPISNFGLGYDTNVFPLFRGYANELAFLQWISLLVACTQILTLYTLDNIPEYHGTTYDYKMQVLV